MATTAFLFDLDGTLMDSVYQHVLAWREALEKVGIELSVWRIHRRIGMSGGLFLDALLRETGRRFGPDEAAEVRRTHAAAFKRLVGAVRPLPGARDLLTYLTNAKVPWAIATSGWIDSARPMLASLGVPAGVPVITRDQVEHAKPDPDLFLAAAAKAPTVASVETRRVFGPSITVWNDSIPTTLSRDRPVTAVESCSVRLYRIPSPDTMPPTTRTPCRNTTVEPSNRCALTGVATVTESPGAAGRSTGRT